MAETAFQASYRQKKKAGVKKSAMTSKGRSKAIKPKGYLWAGYTPGPGKKGKA